MLMMCVSSLPQEVMQKALLAGSLENMPPRYRYRYRYMQCTVSLYMYNYV